MKRTTGAFCAVGVLALLLAWGISRTAEGHALTLLQEPFFWLGQELRRLSLSSGAGNGAAWALCLLAALLPSLPALALRWKRRSRAEDWLLPIASLHLFLTLYLAVNPFLVSSPVEVWLPMLGGAFWVALASWGILRLLSLSQRQSRESLPHLAGRVLRGAAWLLMALGAFGSGLTLFTQMAQTAAANTDAAAVSFTGRVMTGLTGAGLIPLVLTCLLLDQAGRLVRQAGLVPFQAETVALCDRVALLCRWTARISVLVCVACNLVQSLLAGALLRFHIQLALPLSSLLLSFGFSLLCRWLRQGQAIQEDNQSII